MARRALASQRVARKVGRRYWFARDPDEPVEQWEQGRSRSWADAVNRISLSGEVLVVDVSDAERSPDRVARRRIHKIIHANICTCARRRALKVTRRTRGPYMLFRIVE